MTEALLACPFCGSADVMIAFAGSEGRYGLCQDCGAQSTLRTSEAEAVAAWNRRAPGPCPDCAVASEEDGAARERAAIVDWLRPLLVGHGRMAMAAGWLAAAIERGEHLPAKEPGT